MRISTLVVLIVAAGSVAAQEASQSDRPSLQPVFNDDFSEDTRPKYKIKGDVGLQQGKLILPAGASVERTINGGPWTKVELKTKPVELTKQQPRSELRVWFLMEGATNCYVQFRQKFARGKTVYSLALIDTGEKDGKPIELVLREIVADEAELRDVSIEYRHGLVKQRGHPVYNRNRIFTIGPLMYFER